MLNVAEVCPAATTTVAGGVAAALFDDRLTEVPPAGAGPARTMLAWSAVPPNTVVGLSVRPVKFA